jgi:quinoprotein glucose dehydrogenase
MDHYWTRDPVSGVNCMSRTALAFVALLLALKAPAADEGWPRYGNDDGGMRHSSLTQIDRANVADLQVAWQYRTGVDGEGFSQAANMSFQAVPVLHGGTLFFSVGFGQIFAIDAATGKEQWRYDTGVSRDLRFAELASRGVTVWTDSTAAANDFCAVRIFMGNIMGHLHALDANTGRPCADFGENGVVNLREGVRYRDLENFNNYTITSPPVVVGEYLVTGSAVGDNGTVSQERGIVRMYSARSGELLWSWDPIPTSEDDPAYGSWKTGAAVSGGANAWPPLSVDAANNIVFVPTGSPSPDFFGGTRLGDNHYANSLVALDVPTGKVRWHRQLVHHDLWDYDLPAQPVLIDLRKDGEIIPAVVQTTKMGMLFVFNRLTGEPVFPVEERPVPASDIEGEYTSPTQPFSSIPPLVSHAPVTEKDAWGMFYFDTKSCAKKIAAFRSQGVFTPPSLQGTLMNPGYVGGSNWGGLTFDPVTQIAVATVMEAPTWIRLTYREDARKAIERGEWDWEGYTDMQGTPFVMQRGILISPLGVPCTRPPWGKLVGVNLETGSIAWSVPLGTIEDLAPAPVPNLKLGVPVMGGAISTAAGLVFVAGAADDYLRAFDIESGDELWRGRLPAGGQATPMTYSIAGRQYVVIAAGGYGSLGTTLGDFVVAFALPREATRDD